MLFVQKFYCIALLLGPIVSPAWAESDFPKERDPYKWPFAQNSIWNTPIGSDAVFVDAQIKPASNGAWTDQDIIILTPDEPLMDVFPTQYTWGPKVNPETRCIKASDKPLFSLPIPASYVTRFHGRSPNHASAVLMPDGRMLKQTQPFQVCPGGYATTKFTGVPLQDIYGDGIAGTHGGSGLSSIGGTIRVGELAKDAGPIHHALKVNLSGSENLYFDEETKGFRWPALRADGSARKNYQGTNRACRMGALLALPPSINVDEWGLKTEPGKRIARAFQDYGGYIVDNAGQSVFTLATEEGPAGNVREEVLKTWGFQMVDKDQTHPWVQDIEKIFTHLNVIDNNGPQKIGGGGTPRQPLAPPFRSFPATTATSNSMHTQPKEAGNE